MPDVIVIGGGPGGSTAATLLAQRGYSVTLVEKQKFPRFQIGESLLPYNNEIFDQLGLTEKLKSIPHFPKHGAEFLTGDGSVRNTFRFANNLPDRYARAYQVTRADFDQMLLEHARSAGVEVLEETAALSVQISDESASVRVAGPDKVERSIEARFVVDASGLAAVLAQQDKSRNEHPGLRKLSLFAHYRGVAASAPGDDAGNTVIVVARNGWFWMIPISDQLTSVGVVVDRDEFRQSGLQAETFLARAIESTPYVFARMTGSQRVSTVYARKDFSYRVNGIAGPRFAMAGDAAGFIDPIFSTGVFMAMKSASLVAEAIDARLRTGSMRELRAYERCVRRSLDLYLTAIEHFYRREFLEVFLQPRILAKPLGLTRAVVGLLAGDVFDRAGGRWRMRLFYFLVRMQKRFGVIAPRIAWEGVPSILTSSRTRSFRVTPESI